MEEHHKPLGPSDGWMATQSESIGMATSPKPFGTWHVPPRHGSTDYPLLNEEGLLGEGEYEATIENITDAAWRVTRETTNRPKDWERSECLSIESLRDHDAMNVKLRTPDDRGGYPSGEESLRRKPSRASATNGPTMSVDHSSQLKKLKDSP